MLGHTQPFFEIEGFIIDVQANLNRSLFAIHYLDQEENAVFVIVDETGNVRLEFEEYGEQYSIYWNPYKKEELILVSYLPDWELDTYYINVEEEQVNALPLDNSYFQWLAEDVIGYLNWDQLEPDYQAPLYAYQLSNGDTEHIRDDVIALWASLTNDCCK